MVPQLCAILALIPPSVAVSHSLTAEECRDNNAKLARNAKGIPCYAEAVCADVARWHCSAEARILHDCLLETLGDYPEHRGPSLWLADGVCLVYPKNKPSLAYPTMLELVRQDIRWNHPYMDGIKGGNQVRDYGQGSDRQAGYLTQVRDHIEERMGDKLCHPLAEHQRRTGNLDHPVGTLGFARTLCATAGYYGLPIATPFYFRYLSQQREICKEAFLSLRAAFASLDESQRAPIKACGTTAPWATAGPSREPLRRDEVGLRQETAKTASSSEEG